MCRLIAVKDRRPFAMSPILASFAEMAHRSREYQGDGWGCAWHDGHGWQLHRSVTPVWADDLARFGATRLLLAHARSAFRNEGIQVENNMPFIEDRLAFAFNGELHGVRIREAGRIGAEKLFNTIRRVTNGSVADGLAKAAKVIRRRSAYVRAMNVLLSDGETIYLHSFFSEQPEYFTMHVARSNGRLVICSEPLPVEAGWQPLPNDTLEAFE
jgi:predicted glutamine amidotransferase